MDANPIGLGFTQHRLLEDFEHLLLREGFLACFILKGHSRRSILTPSKGLFLWLYVPLVPLCHHGFDLPVPPNVW